MNRNGFEVKPIPGGGYELIPTQIMFAVASTEDALWKLATEIDALIAKLDREGEEDDRNS